MKKLLLFLILAVYGAFAQSGASPYDVLYPSDAGWINVMNYGCVGDGVHDDTACIQNAMNQFNTNGLIFLPAAGGPGCSGSCIGTYLVSNSLVWGGNTPTSGIEINGQNSGTVTIKLKDNTFTNASCDPEWYVGSPTTQCKSLLYTNSNGSGNENGYKNDIHDISIDLGSGNTGASAIDWNCSNESSIRNVVIKGNAGRVGIIGARGNSGSGQGPCYAENVKISGSFDYGIVTGSGEVGITWEHIAIGPNHISGFHNESNNVFARDLEITVSGAHPAVENLSGGNLTLVDSTATGTGSSTVSAISNSAFIYVRNFLSGGFNSAINGQSGTSIGEYPSGGIVTLFTPSASGSLNLPVNEPPALYQDNVFTNWVKAAMTCSGDQTAALQTAMNAGKATVYLPNACASYEIDGTVTVPTGVRRIISTYSQLTGIGTIQFNASSGGAVEMRQIQIALGSTLKIVNNQSGGVPLHLVDILGYGGGGYDSINGNGLIVYMEDVAIPDTVAFEPGVSAWLRQFDVETDNTHFTNNNATVWILGYKTEGHGNMGTTTGGGKTEILGSDNSAHTSGSFAGYTTTDSSVSFAGVFTDSLIATPLTETRSGVTHTYANQGTRLSGTVFSLYAGYNGSSGATCAGGGGGSGISCVQNADAGDNTGTTLTTMSVAFPVNVTSGNLLIAVCSYNDSTAATMTISSTSSLWTPLTAVTNSLAHQRVFYSPNSVAGANTVTCNYSAAVSNPAIQIFEYSGLSTGAVDVSASATGTGTTVSSGNVTTTSATELIFAAAYAVPATTAGAGYSPRFLNVAAGGASSEDKIQTVAGTQSATFTLASSSAWAITIVAFKTAPVAITSDTIPPIVLQGATHNFTANKSVTWSLTSGSVGSINSATGVYTAPASVKVNNSIYGCQVFPPDHAFNAPIDTLPVRAESGAWLQLLINANGPLVMGPYDVQFAQTTASTPTYSFTFNYTPLNNGLYAVPDPPDVEYKYTAGDKHLINVFSDSCNAQEIYNSGLNASTGNIYPNTASGTKYPSMNGAVLSYFNGGVNAAMTPFTANSLRAEEIEKALATGASDFGHPIQVTLHNYTELGGGIEWPAVAQAVSSPNTIPYGARFRLKSTYTYSGSNPVTSLLINNMKKYGFIVSDGGFSLYTYGLDFNQMDSLEASAIVEIHNLGMPLVQNFEFVKQETLAPAVTTGADGGLLDPAAAATAGYTMPQFAQVIATDGTGATAKIRVLLEGPTLDFRQAIFKFQAGASVYNLPYFINNAGSSAVTCSISPVVGSINASTCAYTPPATVASPTIITVTITSNAIATLKTQAKIIIMPNGDLRMTSAAPSDYTDTHGNKWWAAGINSPFPMFQYATIAVANPYQDAPTNLTDYYVYGYGYHPRSDTVLDMQVAPGQYKVTVNMLGSSTHYFQYLECQNQAIYPYLDTYNIASGSVIGGSFPMPCVVGSDGRLFVTSRRVDGYGTPPVPGADTVTYMPSVLIQADPSGTPHISINPSPAPVPITAGGTQQFTCIGWYMANTCTWAVTSGPGTINSSGLYTAPATAQDPDVPVTITATSTVDGTKTATSTLTLTFGTIVLAPAASSTDRELTTQFSASINSVAYTHVTWSINPAIGSINASTGLYTAPSTLSSDTTITVTATSTDNATHSGSTTLLIRAQPLPIRLAPGLGYPYSNTYPLIDSNNVSWITGTQYATCNTSGDCYGPEQYSGVPLATASATLPPVEIVNSSTANIWSSHYRGGVYTAPPTNDFTFTFTVPNGSYLIGLGFNIPTTTYSTADQANAGMTISVNGAVYLSNFNPYTQCGINVACSPTPLSLTVTTHQIVILFHANYSGHIGAANTYACPQVNLIQITPNATVQLPQISFAPMNGVNINLGDSATLSWNVTGANTISIDHGIGTVSSSGSTTVSPTVPTTYTLSATNNSGTSTATVNVNINPPVINSFTATPSSVNRGSGTILTWSVSGAQSLSIDKGVGTVTGSSLVFVPSQAGDYTMTATNSGGTATSVTTITLTAPSTIKTGKTAVTGTVVQR